MSGIFPLLGIFMILQKLLAFAPGDDPSLDKTIKLIFSGAFQPNVIRNRAQIDESDYPEEEIKTFLDKHQILKSYFMNPPVVIGNRFGEEGNPACGMREVEYKPRNLTDIFGKPRKIINQEGFEQKVIARQCIRKANVLSDDTTMCDTKLSLHLGKSSECVQEYVAQELMIYDSDEKDKHFVLFPIPSGCSCVLHN